MISSLVQFVLGMGIPIVSFGLTCGFVIENFSLTIENLFRWLLLMVTIISISFFLLDVYALSIELKGINKAIIIFFFVGTLIYLIVNTKPSVIEKLTKIKFPKIFSTVDEKISDFVNYLINNTKYRHFDNFLIKGNTFVMIIKILLALPILIIPHFFGLGIYHTYRLLDLQINRYEPITFRTFLDNWGESEDTLPNLFIFTFFTFFGLILIHGFIDHEIEGRGYERFIFLNLLFLSYIILFAT